MHARMRDEPNHLLWIVRVAGVVFSVETLARNNAARHNETCEGCPEKRIVKLMLYLLYQQSRTSRPGHHAHENVACSYNPVVRRVIHQRRAEQAYRRG